MSKSSTLLFLRNSIKIGYVPKLIVFSVNDFIRSESALMEQISNEFAGQQIAVRSSAITEDLVGSSAAGKYHSVLSIDSADKTQTRAAIDAVISSYGHPNTSDTSSTVIIQEMVRDVSVSGVIFSYQLSNGAPYYVINYDDMTGRTDTVTSGSSKHSNRSLYIYRPKSNLVRSPRFKALLEAVREIEQILNSTSLDVEFALLDDNRVAILQAREIGKSFELTDDLLAELDETLQKTENDLNHYFSEQLSLNGNFPILGQMPDWNPAEMIGRLPHPLSMSLYESLITNYSWEHARFMMGYKRVMDKSLMTSFAGHPYIDVQKSFYSFLPAELEDNLGKKIVTSWLNILRKNPELHDKIEFSIATTCFSFDVQDKLELTLSDSLSKKEIRIFRDAIVKQADGLVSLEGTFAWACSKIEILDELANHPSKLESKEVNSEKIRIMLTETIEYGTIPFAILARHGFIAKTILDSLVTLNILSSADTDSFLNSVTTVASDFLSDTRKLNLGLITKAIFLEKYGHLRPGTYEVNSPRYDKMPNFEKIFMSGKDSQQHVSSRWTPTPAQVIQIDERLKSFGLRIDVTTLLDYVAQSIVQRERAKFVFTKNLSKLLEELVDYFSLYGFSRNQISFIELNDLLSSLELSREDATEELKRLYEKNQNKHAVNTLVRLPEVIVEPSAAFVVPFVVNQPNFITSSTVTAQVAFLDLDEELIPSDITGKIVVLRGADPGFDWIFSHKIVGLVTKYGGMNSHMAIRCAEFDLPAAIGLGEKLYESLVEARRIQLDCKAKKVTVIT